MSYAGFLKKVCYSVIMLFFFQVQIYDQIVFESIKSPGHFLHASAGFQIDHFTLGQVY